MKNVEFSEMFKNTIDKIKYICYNVITKDEKGVI